MSRRRDRPFGLPKHLKPLFDNLITDKAAASIDNVVSGRLDKLSTSRIGRAARVSSLALRGGRDLLMGKAKALVTGEEDPRTWTVDLAAHMLESLSAMRGLSMKLGQMLSYVEDGLPPEARKVLSLLQRDASPMPFEVIEPVLREAFGAPPDEVFGSFERRAVAAASIGQVHRATLPDGTPVAVKVQYPGIEDAITADLKNARLVSLLKQLFFFRTDITSIMGELEERFLDECNYEKEADYQQAYDNRFQGHPFIVVPEVFRDYSSRRVLTTRWYEGMSFYEWLARNPTSAERERATRLFYRFYIGSLYLDGLFNCDPHPGNYLFLQDGRIVFLDYGCSRRFPASRLAQWVDLCRATFEDRQDELDRLARTMGFIPAGVDYDRDAFRLLMRYLYAPYIEDAPFDFRLHKPENTFRQMFIDNPNLFKMNMPADSVFLNRIGFGLVSLLAEMGSTMNCRRVVTSYFKGIDPDWPDDPHRGRTPLHASPTADSPSP